uniref:Artemin a n=1 Tax=Callorhinchus milii TaxID=7868 RepID=A0A4W3GSD4_CALMI
MTVYFVGETWHQDNEGCRIRKRNIKVGALGLGYMSEEIVLFKYCSGSCQLSRTNYDLTLTELLKQRVIPSFPNEKVISHPCCRPVRYEDVTFLDLQNKWQRVEHLSAAECKCIG